MEKIYVTVTDIYCEDVFSFDLGEIIRLKKEPDNSHDHEAIKAEIPCTGKIGYVANSSETVVKGTMSAGRIYDKIEKPTYVKIIFITGKELICEFLDYKKSMQEIEAIESLFEKCDEEKLSNDREDLMVNDNFIINEEEKEFDGNIEGHIFEIGLKNGKHNTIPPVIKNKLLDLVLNTLQPRYIESSESEFSGEGTDLKFKESADVRDNSMTKIDHDEIAIFTYKKEGLIDKYFKIKKKILDIDDSISYEINDKEAHFYYNGIFFASIAIDDNFVSIAIESDDKLEAGKNIIEIKNKNSYLYEFNIEEEYEIEELIKFIQEVLFD